MLRELNIAREPFILFSKEKPYRVHVVLCFTADKKCAASALFQWNGLGTCVDDDSRYFKNSRFYISGHLCWHKTNEMFNQQHMTETKN